MTPSSETLNAERVFAELNKRIAEIDTEDATLAKERADVVKSMAAGDGELAASARSRASAIAAARRELADEKEGLTGLLGDAGEVLRDCRRKDNAVGYSAAVAAHNALIGAYGAEAEALAKLLAQVGPAYLALRRRAHEIQASHGTLTSLAALRIKAEPSSSGVNTDKNAIARLVKALGHGGLPRLNVVGGWNQGETLSDYGAAERAAIAELAIKPAAKVAA